MALRALCQDCLRAPTFATSAERQKAHEGETLCVCGGELCACQDCMKTLRQLERGDRGNINMVIGPVINWSAEGGSTK